MAWKNYSGQSLMGKVSILMPVKNAGSFLRECLQSILDQTYSNWELIAVDDHSTDQSSEVFSQFKDPRIQLLSNTGQGIIPALELALEISTGQYITRMDADDLMPPQRLEQMVDLLDHSAKDTIVTGLVKYLSDQPISDGYLKYETWLNKINLAGTQWENIYRECVIASPNWMTPRKILEQIGGFQSLVYPEDYHLVLKWYQQHLKVVAIPEITLLWREHPLRTSRNSANYSQGAFFNLKINVFIQTDLRSGDLILWGRNEKTKLTSQIFKKAKISFHHFDLSDFHLTEKVTHPQVLVGVYPEKEERVKIEEYLSGMSLVKGQDWWYI